VNGLMFKSLWFHATMLGKVIGWAAQSCTIRIALNACFTRVVPGTTTLLTKITPPFVFRYYTALYFIKLTVIF